MALTLRIIIFIIGTLFFITVLELVRQKKFREELSIIWLGMSFGVILSSFADLIIDPLAFALGISYPPALVFLIICFLFALVMLYFSLVVSNLKSKNKELAQKIALMEYKLNKKT